MHAWKHWLLGGAFFGFGTFKLLTDGSIVLVGLCALASGYIFYRALTDQTGAVIDDLGLAVDFVSNPFEMLTDQTLERLGDDDEDHRAKGPGPSGGPVSRFAAHERANIEAATRDRTPAMPANPQPAAPPVQGFGRKRA